MPHWVWTQSWKLPCESPARSWSRPAPGSSSCLSALVAMVFRLVEQGQLLVVAAVGLQKGVELCDLRLAGGVRLTARGARDGGELRAEESLVHDRQRTHDRLAGARLRLSATDRASVLTASIAPQRRGVPPLAETMQSLEARPRVPAESRSGPRAGSSPWACHGGSPRPVRSGERAEQELVLRVVLQRLRQAGQRAVQLGQSGGQLAPTGVGLLRPVGQTMGTVGQLRRTGSRLPRQPGIQLVSPVVELDQAVERGRRRLGVVSRLVLILVAPAASLSPVLAPDA